MSQEFPPVSRISPFPAFFQTDVPRHTLVACFALAILTGSSCGKSDEGASAARGPVATGQLKMPNAATGGTAASNAGATDTGVVVNGTTLTAETIHQLQMLYPVPIPPGRYWYDGISGAWGREGQPIAGQMLAGLTLGGPLAADASRGTSNVYINGRQLTVGEKRYIEQLCQTPVVTARYWVLSNGVGGYEGGPALFNLGQCPGVPRQNGGSSSSTRTYCDANGACTSTGILGSITTARF